MSTMTCGCDFDCQPKAHYCDEYPSCVGGRFLSGFYGSWTPEQARAATMEQDAKGKTAQAPTRASTFPKDAAGRKRTPVGTGVLDYFPDAMVAIAQVSHAGNEQHNPGQPLHWDRAKSGDESDAMMRHYLQRGQWDVEKDGTKYRHSAKMAWRALAFLQKEIEADVEQARMNKAAYKEPTEPEAKGKTAPVYERTRMESQ